MFPFDESGVSLVGRLMKQQADTKLQKAVRA
jgi:hypothetical protein